jgi:hypothetical protein
MNTSQTNDMIKIATGALTGPALDWAVAKCEGIEVVAWRTTDRDAYFVVLKEAFEDKEPTTFYGDPDDTYYPSYRWEQGGPIIDRKKISIIEYDGVWKARKENEGTLDSIGSGPTPLIAAMRCRVASKLGDAIEIPKELV